MIEYNPMCVADMKNPLCHFYIRIYKMHEHCVEKINKNRIEVSKGFIADFIEEVEARFIEWGCSEYRISFPFDGTGSEKHYNSDIKRLDIRFNDSAKYKVFGNYVFVLITKVEKGFKSQCK